MSQDFRLALFTNGGGTFFGKDKLFSDGGGYNFLESCLRDLVNKDGTVPASSVSCATLQDTSCVSTGCGVCSCGSGRQLGGTVSWSASAILFADGSATTYCVTGNTLVMGAAGRLIWERFEAGSPAPCATRPLATCDSETASGGCHVGRCKWGGKSGEPDDCPAEVSSRLDCEGHFGCVWDGQVCGGTAFPMCAPQDIDKVPGCGSYPLGSTCTGTATGCESHDAVDCLEFPRCSLVTGCTGGTKSCSEVFAMTNVCYTSIGCTLSGSSCDGMIDCAKVQSRDSCSTAAGCQWATNACVGTPPACATYGLGECEYRGCKLTSP